MDFHKYLQQEFGLHQQDKKLSQKELDYYTTLSQKLYEENFLLILSAIFLGGFALVGFFFTMQSNLPVISGRISTLLLSISCVSVLLSIIYSFIAHSLFTHFQMISRDTVASSNRILSAINNAYVYKQTSKTLFVVAVIALIMTVTLLLTADIKLILAFFLCIAPIFLPFTAILK